MNSTIILAVLALGLLLLLLFVAAVMLRVFHIWFQCFTSNAAVPVSRILTMQMRGLPARKICEQRIKASYIGVDLSTDQLESAHQRGVDIESAVDRMCSAKRAGESVRWDDFITANSST